MPEQTLQNTVVVTQRVRPGCEEAFSAWQDLVNRAVAAFPGFLGTEASAAQNGSGEWSIVYRFDSSNNLNAWLDSDERHRLLERATELVAAPATQQIVATEKAAPSHAVVVSHRVPSGREKEFLRWQARMKNQELKFPGFQGSELFPPVTGIQSDWTVVYRFDTSENLERWLNSTERKQMLEEGSAFSNFDLHRLSSPFGSWFANVGDAQAPAAADDWKTALMVLLALYPTVMVLTLIQNALWSNAPLWLGMLLGNIVSVSLLTWVVMPIVMRAFRFWLGHPAPPPKVSALGITAAIVFLAFSAGLFWLLTAVILPAF